MKLLPDSIKKFLINRLLEVTGISSIILSLYILVSISSYSSFDPNLYNFSNYSLVNFGGYIGANISEILLQLFGYSSFLICVILFSWSYKLFFTKSLNLFALNLLFLPLSVLTLSFFFELTGLIISNGFITEQIFLYFENLNIVTGDYFFYLTLALLLITFSFFFYLAMGLNNEEWRRIFLFIFRMLKELIILLSKIINIRNNLYSNNQNKLYRG